MVTFPVRLVGSAPSGVRVPSLLPGIVIVLAVFTLCALLPMPQGKAFRVWGDPGVTGVSLIRRWGLGSPCVGFPVSMGCSGCRWFHGYRVIVGVVGGEGFLVKGFGERFLSADVSGRILFFVPLHDNSHLSLISLIYLSSLISHPSRSHSLFSLDGVLPFPVRAGAVLPGHGFLGLSSPRAGPQW